jgi:1,2-diacylglycerol 3-alpha-glucosyltransferase
MKKLRVAFVADTVAGRLGGGVIAGRNLVEALRREHDVRVVAADAHERSDVQLKGFRLPLAAMREMEFTMARPDGAALARAFAEVDVVHVQFPFWLGVAAVREARRAGKPVVAAFHVQPENLLLNMGIRSPWLSGAVYRTWVRSVFDRAAAVICPTVFAERKLRSYGLRAPAFVISNGVPEDVRAHGPAGTERKLPGDDGPWVVVCVGRLAADKRLETAVDAVGRSRHRDRIRLVLAGGGPLEKKLRALGASLPHPAEVGFLPRGRLLQELATADLFVHPSEVELEGIAVLEAMSLGLPVVVAESDESAASAFAISDDFRFPAGNAEALACRIDALLEHPLRLATARESVRQMARPFQFASSVEALVSVYRSALA